MQAGASGIGAESINVTSATRARRGVSEASTVTASDIYCSVRSDLSDQQPSQNVVSMRSPALVVPSPTCRRPIQLVGAKSLKKFKMTYE